MALERGALKTDMPSINSETAQETHVRSRKVKFTQSTITSCMGVKEQAHEHI